MLKTTNQKLQDRAIRHAVFLLRLRNGEANKISRLLNQAIPEISRDISTRLAKIDSAGTYVPSDRRIQRMRQLRVALQERVAAIELLPELKKDLSELALTEAEFTARVISQAIPAELSIALRQPPAQLLRSMVTSRPFEGKVLKQWTDGVKRSTVDRVMTQINLGLTRGESTRQLSSRVRQQLRTTKQEAEAVARTAVNHVSAQAREMTHEENSDLIKEVRWVSTLDDRTSLVCAGLDGRTFPVNEGPRPPAHFNCRSTTVPVVKSLKELGFDAKALPASTRASMNGEVPDTETYGKWLKRQDESVQREVLGKARFELFQKGTPIDRFTDDKFNVLSLDQLRRLEGL